jgi:hypothetical protein
MSLPASGPSTGAARALAPLDTPVLFVVFNRPDVTLAAFEAIRAARPRRLYVAADGPRAHRPGEQHACAEVRRIATRIDWPCDVRTRFLEVNQGCKRAVSGALTWFFEHEPEGIVLEDDCIATPGFFRFCEAMLARYRDDPRVGHVSGTNYQDGHRRGSGSWYFSKYPHVWGWAGWRRAWNLWDGELSGWPEFVRSGRLGEWDDGRPGFQLFWRTVFEDQHDGRSRSSWAFPLTFAHWRHRMLSIVPQQSLVSNVGFGVDATHTRGDPGVIRLAPVGRLDEPLVPPPEVARDREADRCTDDSVFGIGAIAALKYRIRSRAPGIADAGVAIREAVLRRGARHGAGR